MPTGVEMPAGTVCGSVSALCAPIWIITGSAKSVTNSVIAVLDRAATAASAATSHTSSRTPRVYRSVLWVTTQRTKTSVCASAVTSAVSHASAVTVCSVSTVNLDSSSREAAAWKPVQRG
ncbi:hypothetical protein EYF80_027178 [Liparis tanakae]|uniref:Uncharacterized protein n=1 Tax=Liparis tanakae TaxID=230148 RepID=A0A4Z2H9S4_9TELE|nr:hypothetical protein EYF80_027178 [Liparis tanakae]